MERKTNLIQNDAYFYYYYYFNRQFPIHLVIEWWETKVEHHEIQ